MNDWVLLSGSRISQTHAVRCFLRRQQLITYAYQGDDRKEAGEMHWI
jgi:hypothetical protein